MGPMGSVLMACELDEYHFEVPPNDKNLLFDDAVTALKSASEEIDLSQTTSLKCHVNTWGLSSNNYFADDIVTKMKSLTKIDFSDTVKYRHRSDLCMGIKSLLLAATTC